ncbi:MAG TPA: SLC13 family permease [Methylomirabilota bacterium]|jgi:di/tricarboxylate transporter|nr:SLC13 family permease [Methylomirabilota bacterium]
MPAAQLTFFAILIVACGLLVTEKLRNDVVAVLIVIALSVTRLLRPEQALSGFGSEPAIVVAAIFVLSDGLHRTGISERLGQLIGRWAGASWARAIAVIMPSVALLSAFTHHLTTTAIMLPVTLDLARDKGLSASKLLMPLSFAASLGTTITIIGAPAFLIASESLRQAGRPGLGIFSIAPIGLALSAAGTVFVLLLGKLLLPERRGADAGANRFRLEEYFTELTVLQDSPFRGKTVGEIERGGGYTLSVVGVVRRGRRVRGELDGAHVEPGDVLLVRTTPEDIVAIRKEAGVELHPVAQYQPTDGNAAATTDDDPAERLVQAVVAPGSEVAGRTIADVDFRRRYDAIVVGLWRRHGWLDEELSRTRLRAGDVLVLQGDDEALARVAAAPGILMMVPFHGEGRLRRKAPLAGAIMLATVLAAAFNVVSIEIAGLMGAVAMVITGCLTGGQAYRAIDARIFVFIAGAIPLGLAMSSSGAAKTLAGALQAAVAGWNQRLVLLVLFAVVAVITQFMSDSATTALFAPVAIALAQALQQPPEPYVVTVAMASVVAFLTPIGHHGNLLIYAPGGYRFADFVRVGAPLTVVAALVVVLLAPMLWTR